MERDTLLWHVQGSRSRDGFEKVLKKPREVVIEHKTWQKSPSKASKRKDSWRTYWRQETSVVEVCG